MRIIALCKRNYLFADADSGRERAASIYALVATAKLNGLNPETYLGDILGTIAGGISSVGSANGALTYDPDRRRSVAIADVPQQPHADSFCSYRRSPHALNRVDEPSVPARRMPAKVLSDLSASGRCPLDRP
jgi:hypothetical protein